MSKVIEAKAIYDINKYITLARRTTQVLADNLMELEGQADIDPVSIADGACAAINRRIEELTQYMLSICEHKCTFQAERRANG